MGSGEEWANEGPGCPLRIASLVAGFFAFLLVLIRPRRRRG